MDSNTIKEIANQLGIATDAVTKEVIPAYAQFKIGFNVYGIILVGILFIAALVLTVFFIKRGIAAKAKNGYDDDSNFILGGIAGTGTVILFIWWITTIASLVLWTYYPYGSFINMILAH